MSGTSLLRKLARTLLHFRAAQSGNVALAFGLSVIPVIGLVGSAVDYYRRFNHVLTGGRRPEPPLAIAADHTAASPLAPSTNLTTPSSLPTRPRL